MSILSATITITGGPLQNMEKEIALEVATIVNNNALELLKRAKSLFPPERTVERITPEPKKHKNLKNYLTIQRFPASNKISKLYIGGTLPVFTYMEFGTGPRGAADHNPNKNPKLVTYGDGKRTSPEHKDGSPGHDYIHLGMIAQPFLYPAAMRQQKPFIDSLVKNLSRAITEWALRNHPQ